ncbi:MAG: GlsB/YeaQ/YmgE family stress response membrane protein [Candidatus Omnitrophota bacterium]
MEHNTAGYWVWFLIIGGVIGWLAGLIVRGRGFGIIGDIVIGIVGAMLGGWLAKVIGLSTGSSFGTFLVALVGAVILVGLTRLAKRTA